MRAPAHRHVLFQLPLWPPKWGDVTAQPICTFPTQRQHWLPHSQYFDRETAYVHD